MEATYLDLRGRPRRAPDRILTRLVAAMGTFTSLGLALAGFALAASLAVGIIGQTGAVTTAVSDVVVEPPLPVAAVLSASGVMVPARTSVEPATTIALLAGPATSLPAPSVTPRIIDVALPGIEQGDRAAGDTDKATRVGAALAGLDHREDGESARRRSIAAAMSDIVAGRSERTIAEPRPLLPVMRPARLG